MADEDSAAAELQELTDDFFDVVGSEEGDFDVKDAVVYVAYEKGLTADGSNFLWRVQTRRSSRGKNFAGACISFKLEGEPAELQVRRNNDSAQRAYQKASFEFCEPSLEFPLHGRLNGRGQTVYLAMSTPAVKKVEPLQPLKFFVRAASTLSEAEFELMVHLTMKEEGHKVSKAYAEKVVKGAGEMRYVFGVLDTAAAEPGSDRCLSRTLARPDITQRPLPSMTGWPSETAQGDHTHTHTHTHTTQAICGVDVERARARAASATAAAAAADADASAAADAADADADAADAADADADATDAAADAADATDAAAGAMAATADAAAAAAAATDDDAATTATGAATRSAEDGRCCCSCCCCCCCCCCFCQVALGRPRRRRSRRPAAWVEEAAAFACSAR